MRRNILGLVFIFVLLFSVSARAQKAQILAQSKKAVAALRNKDLKTLGELTHPIKGLRFSPYGYVDAQKDLTFKKSQVPTLFGLRRKMTWGTFDGSGEDIALTFADYYKKFVYDFDFAAAPQAAYNKIVKQGNTNVNLPEAYPNAEFVEYHYPGTRKNERMDWRSLRLVFEKSGGKWYLVGISHDQWTI